MSILHNERITKAGHRIDINTLRDLKILLKFSNRRCRMSNVLGQSRVFCNRKVPSFAAIKFYQYTATRRFMHRFDMEPLWA